VRYSALQKTGIHDTLSRVAACCSALQCVAVRCRVAPLRMAFGQVAFDAQVSHTIEPWKGTNFQDKVVYLCKPRLDSSHKETVTYTFEPMHDEQRRLQLFRSCKWFSLENQARSYSFIMCMCVSFVRLFCFV